MKGGIITPIQTFCLVFSLKSLTQKKGGVSFWGRDARYKRRFFAVTSSKAEAMNNSEAIFLRVG